MFLIYTDDPSAAAGLLIALSLSPPSPQKP